MTPSNPFDDYAALDKWGKDAAPQHQFAVNIEVLPNGGYDCEFIVVELDTTSAGLIARATIKVLPTGDRVEHIYWFNKQQGVNAFLADMKALGLPAQLWGNGPGKTPLSAAIPAAAARLAGVRFRAVKTSRLVPAKDAAFGQPAQKERTYHDLQISGRLGAAATTPMPPVMPPNGMPGPFAGHVSAAPTQHTPTAGVPAGAGWTGAEDDDKIPFSILPFLFTAIALGGMLA